MFTIIKPGTKIDFVGKMRICAIISVITVVACLVLVATRMNYGVDFRGGAEIEIKSSRLLPLMIFVLLLRRVVLRELLFKPSVKPLTMKFCLKFIQPLKNSTKQLLKLKRL